MKYKISCLSLVIFVVLMIINTAIANAYSQEISKKRIIVLVYDDSQSMGMSDNSSPKWGYANYSLQTLTALLGNNDQLYVVCMSNPNIVNKINLASDRQKEINQIQAWRDEQGTPFSSVLTAMDKLKDISKVTEGDFWLVLLSDGNFVSSNANGKEINNIKLNLANFKSEMSGKNINFVFIPIGNDVSKDMKEAWTLATGESTLDADTADEIISRMNEVAALITNRDPNVKNSSLNPVTADKNEIMIKSAFPLKKITIFNQVNNLNQDSKISVKTIEINGKKLADFKVDGPFKEQTPYGLSSHFNIHVNSSVNHITRIGNKVIPDGNIKIIFNQDISQFKRDISFLAESAIDFNVKFYRGNSKAPITNFSSTEFYKNEKVRVEMQFTKAGTKEPINLKEVKDLDSQMEVYAKIENGLSFKLKPDISNNIFTGEVNLKKGNNDIDISAIVKGFYKGNKKYTINVAASDLIPVPPKKISLITENNWKGSLGDIDNSDLIRVNPAYNGKEMTKKELKDLYKRYKLSAYAKRLKFDVQKKEDGYYLKPKKNFITAFTASGKIDVKLTLRSNNGKNKIDKKFTIELKEVSFWEKYGVVIAGFIVLIVLLWWIVGIIKKPRFNKRSAYIEYKRNQKINGMKISNGYNSTYFFKVNWLKSYIIPFIAEKVIIEGVTFKAGLSKNYIILTKEAQRPEMVICGDSLKEDYGKKDLRISDNDEIVVESTQSVEIFKYIK